MFTSSAGWRLHYSVYLLFTTIYHSGKSQRWGFPCLKAYPFPTTLAKNTPKVNSVCRGCDSVCTETAALDHPPMPVNPCLPGHNPTTPKGTRGGKGAVGMPSTRRWDRSQQRLDRRGGRSTGLRNRGTVLGHARLTNTMMGLRLDRLIRP